MPANEARPRLARNLFFAGGVAWLLLSAWAFWAYYSGSAPFDTLGIPVSQLVLGIIFIWIGWRRAKQPIR